MKIKKQFGEEQEGAASTGTESGGSTAAKWDSGVIRGKANPIDSKSKWDSGVTRGKANLIDSKTKWDSGVTRGKANPLS